MKLHHILEDDRTNRPSRDSLLRTRELNKIELELAAKGIESLEQLHDYREQVDMQADREHRRVQHFVRRITDERKYGTDQTEKDRITAEYIAADSRMTYLVQVVQDIADIINRRTQDQLHEALVNWGDIRIPNNIKPLIQNLFDKYGRYSMTDFGELLRDIIERKQLVHKRKTYLAGRVQDLSNDMVGMGRMTYLDPQHEKRRAFRNADNEYRVAADELTALTNDQTNVQTVMMWIKKVQETPGYKGEDWFAPSFFFD